MAAFIVPNYVLIVKYKRCAHGMQYDIMMLIERVMFDQEENTMKKETTGTVVSAARQWWLKINTKPVRMHSMDGAIFPYIIKVKYTVDGKEYTKGKWIGAGKPVPSVGSCVTVCYCKNKPSKAKVL